MTDCSKWQREREATTKSDFFLNMVCIFFKVDIQGVPRPCVTVRGKGAPQEWVLQRRGVEEEWIMENVSASESRVTKREWYDDGETSVFHERSWMKVRSLLLCLSCLRPLAPHTAFQPPPTLSFAPLLVLRECAAPAVRNFTRLFSACVCQCVCVVCMCVCVCVCEREIEYVREYLCLTCVWLEHNSQTQSQPRFSS